MKLLTTDVIGMANIFFVIIIGLIFSPIAAGMAFLITYNEYARHYLDKKQPLKIALGIAGVIFIFFVSVSVIAGFFLSEVILK